MKKVLIGLFLLWTCAASMAEVVIYSFNERGNLIGQGKTRSFVAKGYLVFDSNTKDFFSIGSFMLDGQKRYAFTTADNFFYGIATGANGIQTFYIMKTLQQTGQNNYLQLEGVVMKGATSTLKVSSTKTVNFPKVMQGTSFIAGSSDVDFPIIGETTMKAAFLQKDSQASNAAHEEIEDVFARMKQDMESKGFTLSP